MSRVLDALRRARGTRGIALCELAALYWAGVLHWLLFLRAGRLQLSACDWPKEQFYLRAIAASLHAGRLPYFVNLPSGFARAFPQLAASNSSGEGYSALLALPELDVSPQVLLLRWLSPSMFVLCNTLLLYSVGFLGTLGLRQRYRLGFPAFATLFLLLNFNGHLIAHLAVGHSMWLGYFLLPTFVLYLLKWVEEPALRCPPLTLACLLCGLLLQGAVHLFVVAALSVVLVALCGRELRRAGLLAVALASALAAVRILPALLLFWRLPHERFLGGYATVTDVFAALTSIRDAGYPVPNGSVGALGWWEYDAYIGEPGVAVLAYFGIWKAWQAEQRAPGRTVLLAPLVVLALLSLSAVAFPLYALHVPLLASERVTSRFLVLPLLVSSVLACIQMQESHEALSATPLRRAALAIAFVIEALALAVHSERWSLSALERSTDFSWHEPSGAIEFVQPRPAWASLYYASLIAGLAVSAASVVLCSFLLWLARREDQVGRSQASRGTSPLTPGAGLVEFGNGTMLE